MARRAEHERRCPAWGIARACFQDTPTRACTFHGARHVIVEQWLWYCSCTPLDAAGWRCGPCGPGPRRSVWTRVGFVPAVWRGAECLVGFVPQMCRVAAGRRWLRSAEKGTARRLACSGTAHRGPRGVGACGRTMADSTTWRSFVGRDDFVPHVLVVSTGGRTGGAALRALDAGGVAVGTAGASWVRGRRWLRFDIGDSVIIAAGFGPAWSRVRWLRRAASGWGGRLR